MASLAFPNIDPVALRIGPVAVHWYGLAYLAGFVAAVFIARYYARRWNLGVSDDDLLTILLCAVVGVVAGGRLGYVLVYGTRHYLTHPGEIFAIWDGGMSFHGGLAGIMLAAVVAGRLLKMPTMTLWDLGSIGAPVGIGLGRLANFVNDELWGRPSNAPWAVAFPSGGYIPRHPSQLYEAALEGLLLFGIMLWLARSKPPRPRGELIGWMVAWYGVLRTFAEFFRQPDVQIGFLPGGVTMGQVLSLPMIAVGIALVVWSRKRALPESGPQART